MLGNFNIWRDWGWVRDYNRDYVSHAVEGDASRQFDRPWQQPLS